MTPATLRYQWITDAQCFLALQSAWDELGQSSIDTMFLTHVWLRTWLEELAPDAQLHILTAWDSERLVAALPLYGRHAEGRGRRWRFMGTGILTPNHLDVIAEDNVRVEATAGFLGELARVSAQWDVLEFDKVPEDTATAAAIESAFGALGYSTSRAQSAICPYSRLPSSFDEYVAGRRPRMRKKIRQTLRRFSEQPGPTSFVLATTETEAHAALDDLIRLHQTRWNELGYPGAFADPAVARFHHAIMRAGLGSGMVRLLVLRDGDETVAVNYDFHVHDTLQAYLSSFDKKWFSWSPGILTCHHAIEHAIREGVTCFDFLEGDEAHKADWCEARQINVRVRVFGHTLSGRLARLGDGMASTAVAFARRWIPTGMRDRFLKLIASRRLSGSD